MLRNFHYIDDKGKDEGQNGMYIPLRLPLLSHTVCFYQFAIVPVNWSSFYLTWKLFVRRDVKQRLIVESTLVPVTIQ